MPVTCFEELLSPALTEDEHITDEHCGKNMEAINIILRFLDHSITKVEVNFVQCKYISMIKWTHAR